MINKKSYFEEVEALSVGGEIKQKLAFLYDCYIGKESCNLIKNEIKTILEGLFKNNFSDEIMIPYKFLDSFIGTVIFTILFSSNEKIYTTKELCELTGFRIQYIHQEMNNGNIPKRKDNNGRYWFSESDVTEYLKKKGKI